MRRTLLTLVAVATVAIAAPPARADASDWMLLEVGPATARVSVGIHVDGSFERMGSGPLVFGFATAAPGSHSFLVDALGGDGLHATTTSGIGGQDVALSQGGASSWTFSSDDAFDLAPGDTAALLVFVANGTFTNLDVSPAADSDPFAVRRTDGTGSAAIRLAGPEDDGTAVAVANVAAGSDSYAATVPAGIAGMFDHYNCPTVIGLGTPKSGCNGRWASPDGRSRSWVGQSGCHTFAGPAGSWSWSFEGAKRRERAGSPIMIAYAPIGENWVLFSSC